MPCICFADLFRRSLLLATLILAGVLLVPATVQAQSSVAPMMNLLKSGRLPESRMPIVIKLIADRGDAQDLGYLFEQATREDGFSPAVKRSTLEALARVSRSRNVVPEADLAAITRLIEQDDPQLRELAIQLAGAWKVDGAAESLSQLVLGEATPPAVARQAMASLVKIGGDVADETIAELRKPGATLQQQMLGIAALAEDDLFQAAEAAAKFLSEHELSVDPEPLIAAFLDQQTGTAVLAGQLRQVELSEDNAKQLLRHLYSIGRSDAELISVLNDAAGISSAPRTLSGEQMQEFITKVREEGDPHRGEKVFRRAEFSCLKCHAVSGAGGSIGPDLSPIGGSSPVDYLLVSILDPDQAIKEAYHTKTVLTVEGRVYSGIVVDSSDDVLVLRDATGRDITIPTEDIDDQIEGKSLMPKGLYSLMTEQELVDLVRFLSELGKPGEFAVRSEPTIQRWRVLKHPSAELTGEIPPSTTIEQQLLGAPSSAWEPAYGLVNGHLPLEELSPEGDVLYLRGDVEVTGAGQITLNVNDTSGVAAWIDDQPVEEWPGSVHVDEGLHHIIFRIDRRQRTVPTLRATVDRGSENSAEYTIVGGP